MNYTFFFLSLSGVAVVVFIAIFEAGWSSRKDLHTLQPTTETTVHHRKGIFASVRKKSQPYPTDEASWSTKSGNIETLWTPAEDTTASETLPPKLPTSPPKLPTSPLPPQTEPEATEIFRTLQTGESSCLQKNLTKESGEIKWQKDTDTCNAWLIDLQGMCNGVDIIIEKIKLNAELNEYLIIAPNMDEIPGEGNVIITSTLNSERKFRMMGGGTTYLKLITDATSSSGILSFSYNCYDKASLTTAKPTTEMATTTRPEDYEVIPIYLEGKSQYEFYSERISFQEAVSEMASKYATTKNISLLSEPTTNSTYFSYIGPCMNTWPNSDKCVKVILGVSLNTTEDKYELTAEHLKDMWNGNTERYISHLGLKVYDVPDDETTLLIWVGISIGVIVLFTLFLGFIWYWQPFRVYKKMKDDEPYEQTPRVTEIYPHDPAVIYEPDLITASYIPPKSPGADSSTDDVLEGRSSIAAQLDTVPKYGPPTGFGAAIHFFGKKQNQRGFEDLDLVVEEEDEISQSRKSIENRQIPYKNLPGTEEEIDTSKALYMPQNSMSSMSFNTPHVNKHYEDEPSGFTNLAYTDDETMQERKKISPKISSAENITGVSVHFDDKPKGYDNLSYNKTEDEISEQTPRQPFHENGMVSLFHDKQRSLNQPATEEEEEEEDEEKEQYPTDNTSGRDLQNSSALASVSESKEDDTTELNERENVEGPRNSNGSMAEDQSLYDIPKFPVRRLSADTIL
ncbi:uncharacterized protein [Anabrus simplex]|uniref:uncharacterized protein isoform X2 n=1 Tax=Anabrus simplex TaxID=316456 RepID=UPI0035A2BDAB